MSTGRNSTVERRLDGVEATGKLAASIAALALPGDVIGLAGDLGTGKTSFARAFIAARAALCGAPEEEVPSPTYTLVQTYDMAGETIWHFDLYRLDRVADAYELGIEEAFSGGLCLIEWPERIAPLLPSDRLDVEFSYADRQDRRHARLVGHGGWASRLAALTDGGDGGG